MKNLHIFHIILCFLGLWILPPVTTIQAQDISINVLSSPASLPLSTTGSIQVDICNTDPATTIAPINKINPQISVGNNIVILGATNTDGSPLTNFAIISNSGSTIRLSNSIPMPSPSCVSFKVIIRGQIIDAPGSIGGITAALAFQDSQPAGNNAFNDNSTTSVNVEINSALGPDLTPITYLRPSLLYRNSNINVVVDVMELNSIATSGPITVKLTRDAKFSLSFDPTASLIGGRTVQNNAWSFNSSDPNYYVLTSNQAFSGGGHMTFGLSGQFNAGATVGVVNISTVVIGTAGEIKLSNNADAEKAEYFQQ